MKKKILPYIFICILIITSCANDLSNEVVNDDTEVVTSEVSVDDITFVDDMYSDYTLDNYTELNGDSSSYYITEAGTYLLTGTINSTVKVEVDDEEDVRLVLNQVSIISSDGPSILIISADDVEISVVDGTTNYLEDGSSRDEYEETDYTGALYSDCDLLLNGTGILNITGNYNNGIITMDDLKLINLIVNVESVDDGIIGKDSLSVYQAEINVEVDGDAMSSTHESDSEKGFIYINSGTFNLVAGDDGIIAENIISIYDGTFNLITGGKGIKSELEIEIIDGTYNINSTDDVLDSNTDLILNSGIFSIITEDDAIKATDSITVNGGEYNIDSCYEGLEAQEIIINSGSITIDSLDDGINSSSESSSGNTLELNGGEINISSTGDCIDVNGSLLMTDGTIILNGPTSYQANSTFDIDNDFVLEGGIIFAFGNSDLVVSPSTSSTQASLTIITDSFYDAETTVSLFDGDGEELLNETSLNSFDSIIITTQDLELGEDYTLVIDDNNIDFTLSSIVTYLDENGITTAPTTTHNRR